MILTDYYRFEKSSLKSKMRLDCTASTGNYPPFESRRATKFTAATAQRDATNIGDLVIYFGNVPDNFSGNAKRKASKSVSIKSENLSSVYIPEVEKPFGYGDFKGTTDALLFVFTNLEVINGQVQVDGVLEIFVARGQNKNCLQLYNLLTDGELDDEMNALRANV